MEHYSLLLESDEYATFIVDHFVYAAARGYNVLTDAGFSRAVADQFLFAEFLDETLVGECIA